jgi:hypothetical protein
VNLSNSIGAIPAIDSFAACHFNRTPWRLLPTGRHDVSGQVFQFPGIQYRSEVTDTEKWRVRGYKADIHPKPEYSAMLYGEGIGRGIMAQRGQQVVGDEKTGKTKVVGKTTEPTPIDISEWHEYTVLAQGNRLTHMLDGKVAVEVTDNYEKRQNRGIIALQLHAGAPMTVYFKDIVLETFPAKKK